MLSLLGRLSLVSARPSLLQRLPLGPCFSPLVPPTLPSQPFQLSSCSISVKKFVSNKSSRALTNGGDISFGNNVSFSKNRTRRSFKVNMFDKLLYSELLGKQVKVKCSAQGMKCVDKYGGLDEYLLRSREGSNVVGALANVRKAIEKRRKTARKEEKAKVKEGGN